MRVAIGLGNLGCSIEIITFQKQNFEYFFDKKYPQYPIH